MIDEIETERVHFVERARRERQDDDVDVFTPRRRPRIIRRDEV